ncbi:hypothetical protein P3W24_01865 [Luteibacter sp. PPL201]|uniref:Energy transducer TonB n=1 Tax=Luteibacter sahnii TaxID=3021977 RepID=A0ABT6B6I4_9GAMM
MHYPGKAPPPLDETHRLAPEGGLRAHGLQPIDAGSLALLEAIKRRPPPRDRLRFTLALAAALIFHIALIFVVRYEMEPRPLVGFAPMDDKPDVLEVRFIDPAPRSPSADVAPPPPAVELPPKVRSREATRPPAPPKPVEPPPATAPEPAPALAHPAIFGADGSIAMPSRPAQATAPTQADFVAHKPTDDAHIMSRKNPVTYKETRFEKDWAPRDENALSGGMRKAMENTTLKKTFDLGHGVRVNCATVLFVLPVGCRGEDPSKASAKDGDARLNMAPARSLADDPTAPPPPTEAQCVAAYRRDERVMQGCPTDTPLKAMDEENAERGRRVGG